jgi:4-hydroxy-tetrahydrodipicolinate synthase
MNRRSFLALSPASTLPLESLSASGAAKQLRGIFPIAQSPFTDADRLDVATLVEELRFLDRGGVHGFVWPQLASEWSTLSKHERLAGAEAVCEAGKRLKPMVVIGVQSAEPADAVQYARHAARCGADALIALPPPNHSDPTAILEYYRSIGQATELPLIVQAVGKLSVDAVIGIWKAAPTVRAVKDEAGEPVMRISEFREKSGGRLAIFTGNHGRTMLDELMRGFSGTMPAAPFADLYAAAWDLWQSGGKRDAVDMFGRAAILIQEINAYGMESIKYLLCLRGVFKNYRTREKPGSSRASLDETSKRNLRELMSLMKPHLRA